MTYKDTKETPHSKQYLNISVIFTPSPNIYNNSDNSNSSLNIPNHNHNVNHNVNRNQSYHTSFILKISGIWENETEYGVTYKLSTC